MSFLLLQGDQVLEHAGDCCMFYAKMVLVFLYAPNIPELGLDITGKCSHETMWGILFLLGMRVLLFLRQLAMLCVLLAMVGFGIRCGTPFPAIVLSRGVWKGARCASTLG